MKKIFTLVAVATFGLGAFAQDYKPSKGTVTTEVGLTGGLGNTGVGLFNGKFETLVASALPTLKFRYFLKDNIGLRLGFAIKRSAVKDTPSSTFETSPTPTPAPTSFTSLTTTINSTRFLMSIGAEKHFKGSDRLSTFVGADILLGTNKNYKEENGTATTPTSTTNTVKITKNSGQRESVFGFGLLTGADYYIAKKVYLGIELGLQMLSINEKDEVVTIENSGTGITTNSNTTTDTPDRNSFSFDTQMNGGIKIGYQF